MEAGAELWCPWGAEGSVQVRGSGQVSGWLCRGEWALRRTAVAKDAGARWACFWEESEGVDDPEAGSSDSSAPRLIADGRFLAL